jgi:hypothetical protein
MSDGVTVTVYAEKAYENLLWQEYMTMEEYISWYGYSLEDFLEENQFYDYSSGEVVPNDLINEFLDYHIIAVDGGDGTIYQFPSDIKLISNSIIWGKIDNNTVYINNDELGLLIYIE